MESHQSMLESVDGAVARCTVSGRDEEKPMKQLSLTEARAKFSTLVADVDRGKGHCDRPEI